MERLLEDLSFSATEFAGSEVRVDAAYVNDRLGEIAKSEDLSRYVL